MKRKPKKLAFFSSSTNIFLLLNVKATTHRMTNINSWLINVLKMVIR